jgi:hypothetical protein
MKNFLLKYLLVLLLIGVGFIGGVLFFKTDHVPLVALTNCEQDFEKVSKQLAEREQKFLQCIIFLNGVLEGKGATK